MIRLGALVCALSAGGLPAEAAEPAPFFFDLNGGQLYAQGASAQVAELVKLARRYGTEGSGEHNVLLNLVAKRTELADGTKVVSWARPYHLFRGPNIPDTYISLRDWLTQQKVDVQALLKSGGKYLPIADDSLAKGRAFLLQTPDEGRAFRVQASVRGLAESS